MKKFERLIIYPMLFIAIFFSFSGEEVQRTTAQKVEDHVIAKRITVVNEDYEGIITLNSNTGDGGIISVYEDEKLIANISSAKNKTTGSIRVFNKYEEDVATLGVASNNHGAVWIGNKTNDKIGVCTYEGYKFIE